MTGYLSTQNHRQQLLMVILDPKSQAMLSIS